MPEEPRTGASTVVEVGESHRMNDGWTLYIMVRDESRTHSVTRRQ